MISAAASIDSLESLRDRGLLATPSPLDPSRLLRPVFDYLGQERVAEAVAGPAWSARPDLRRCKPTLSLTSTSAIDACLTAQACTM